MTAKREILVTGATGKTGRALVELLASRGTQVRALARDPERARGLEKLGARVVMGDLDEPDSLDAAFSGVDKVYFVTWDGPTAAHQGMNVIHAAWRAGGPHVVMHSAWGPQTSRIIQQALEVEEALMASGLPWTILRPTFFMQNTLMAAETIRSDGTIYWPLGEGKVGMIDLRDIAEAGASVLLEEGHEARSYILTGPASISFHEVAATLSEVLRRGVTYQPVPIEAARASMVGAGLDPWVVDGWMELMAGFAEDWGNHVSDTVPRLLGRPARSYREFAQDFALAFAGEPAEVLAGGT